MGRRKMATRERRRPFHVYTSPAEDQLAVALAFFMRRTHGVRTMKLCKIYQMALAYVRSEIAAGRPLRPVHLQGRVHTVTRTPLRMYVTLEEKQAAKALEDSFEVATISRVYVVALIHLADAVIEMLAGMGNPGVSVLRLQLREVDNSTTA